MRLRRRLLEIESGDYLLSRAVASQVPSAYGGLTSVIGMGTGGALQLLSPETYSVVNVRGAVAAAVTAEGLHVAGRLLCRAFAATARNNRPRLPACLPYLPTWLPHNPKGHPHPQNHTGM